MSRITAIGEILFDIYPDGKNLGGAPFNFIYHVIKLTGRGNFISAVGNDKFGAEILDILNNKGIEKKYVQVNYDHPTGAAVANLDEKKIPHWEIKTGTAYDFINPAPVLEELISGGTDCLYFGTLARRSEVSGRTIKYLFNRKNIKYFCDLNIRQNFYSQEIIEDSLITSDALKLNVDELQIVNRLLLNQPFDIINLARLISKKYDIELVCVTMGDKGSYIICGDKDDKRYHPIDNVVDTVGAGDAFAAILCLGFLNGWDISKINRLASEFAAETVKIEGALPKSDLFYEKFKEKIN